MDAKTAVKTEEAFDEGDIGESDLYSKEELIFFRNLLTQKRQEILEEARNAVESGKIQLDTNEMKDEVDLASISMEHELTFRLLDRSRKLLNEVEHAIVKIRTGDYGYCEGTGEVIPRKRLELTPWVRHSVEHKELLERTKKKKHGFAKRVDMFEVLH